MGVLDGPEDGPGGEFAPKEGNGANGASGGRCAAIEKDLAVDVEVKAAAGVQVKGEEEVEAEEEVVGAEEEVVEEAE